MEIKYKVEFFTDWHCGSGLSSGADLDLLVIKDKDKLPFISGKTIKGLVREAVEEIQGFSKSNLDISVVFGSEKDEKGDCFFTNAALEKSLKEVIKENNLQDYMYRSIASTAINNKGIAVKHSLRKMEVTVPCELKGEILDVPDNFADLMEKGLKFIKRLGQNRNRGLGRCQITII
jgi:CRISPR/Cas system CSM-associated protein Csm3 (group 7 of RAMP superfamily)